MLLSSLSILMGAVLVPSDYLWVYSTHIILVCLYLIWSKRLIVLFLTLISFVSVLSSEFSTPPYLPLTTDSELLVDFDNKELISNHSQLGGHDVRSDNQSVRLVYFEKNGVRRTQDDFSLTFSQSKFHSVETSQKVYQGVITRVVLPNQEGSWWQQNLYIKRQAAELTVHFSDEGLQRLEQKPFSVRGRLLAKLDRAFENFDYWRFSKALLLGQDDLWSERDTWMVRTLGLAHLFVVSGLHTGFMFAIGRMISRSVWRFFPNRLLLYGVTRWHCDAVIVIPLLFAYAYITNWGEPVVRASIMLSVYLCARMLALKLSPYSIITFALWLVLLFEPRAVLSPGLWLSFSMVYLLIGFCQTSTKLSRLLMVQVMLSTASMVLILGWQVAISSASILVNILLIPLAAFLWFPWALLSCMEVLIIGSTYSYEQLEILLYYIISFIEMIAFEWPLLIFEQHASDVPRLLMLLLVIVWVYQSPLKRGIVSAIGIWVILFSSMLSNASEAGLSLVNKNNKLILTEKSDILLTNTWVGSDISRLRLDSYLNTEQQGGYFLTPSNTSEITPQILLAHGVKWLILKQDGAEKIIAMLDGMNVKWLVIPAGGSMDFHFQKNRISLQHSSCIYSFFLLKSDTCKRVEKLESVLNYNQT
jgi:competence protein ComEC